MGNGLFITDISQNRIKGGKLAPITGRNMQTTLCHKGQKANGFQCDGLATGVGTGNNHRIEVCSQAQGYGYNFSGVN